MVLILLITLIILMSIDSFRKLVIPVVISQPLMYDLAFKTRTDFINHYIKDFLPPIPATILNFGCGLNLYSDYLVDIGYNVIALDINDVSVSKKIKPIIYDGVKIPSNLKFDCVIVTTVLHHIPEKTTIDILKQLKSSNKQIIIMEDNYSNLSTPLWCMFTNLQFLNHPLNFKTYHEWKYLFSQYFKIKNTKVDDTVCAFNLLPLNAPAQTPRGLTNTNNTHYRLTRDPH